MTTTIDRRPLGPTPTALPVPIADVKQYLAVSSDDFAQDAVIAAQIRAAAEFVARNMWVELLARNWRQHQRALVGPIRLAPNPVLEVLEVRRWTGDQYEAFGGWRFTRATPGLVEPVGRWPAIARGAVYGVQVDYAAGYELAADIPAAIRSAVTFLAAEYFVHRAPERATAAEERALSLAAAEYSGGEDLL